MTEEEAKTKWCPFARTKTLKFSTDDGGVASANRDFDGLPIDHLHTCMASACMAWRRQFWSAEDRARMIVDRQKLKGDTRDAALSWVNQLEEEAAEGYCGLAGAPQ